LLCTLLLGLVPISASAQTNPVFAQPFQYQDRDGTGTMTITPLTADSTRLSFQPIQVTIEQNNRRFTGSGVYHAFSDDNASLPATTLVAFTVIDNASRAFFFQGSIAPLGATIAPPTDFTGTGTYWPVNSPQTPIQWTIKTAGGQPTPGEVVNSTPVLREGWVQRTFNEAIGGTYYATFNTFNAPVSSATWTGNVTAPGRYKIEAFIPRQPAAGVARTNSAAYQIVTDGAAASQTVARISQVVQTSQWVDLGTYEFQQTYRVVLTDQTGEPQGTRSIIANAVRLIPAL
jgi:hypothetical protein